MAENLYSSLARYATSQGENFLTEALVNLLKQLLERETKAGLGILGNLCGNKVASWFEGDPQISISTQLEVEEGRPDIIVQVASDKIVFIEVKHDSGLGVEQLERYYSHLESSNAKDTQLVLLTRSRYSIQETSLDRSLFHHVCWYEISGWLSEADIHDEVTVFLVKQFLEFLKEKEMSMEKVTWEYMQGVPAMINLVNMIGTALAETAYESSPRKTVGANWAGFYLDNVFVGFRYASPLVIVFENNNGNNPTFKREMNLEKEHFFSLNAGEQLECLIKFIGTAYNELPQG